MANVSASFDDMFPYLKAMSALQQRMAEITAPINMVEPAYLKSLTQIADSIAPYATIRPDFYENTQRLVDMFKLGTKITADLDSPMLRYLQKEQDFLSKTILPTVPLTSLSPTIQNWHDMIGFTSYEPNQWLQQRASEMTRMLELAEDISTGLDTLETDDTDKSFDLSENDQQVVADELREILSSPQNWEQRFMKSINKFKETHPVVAIVLEKLLWSFLLGIIVNLASTAIGQAKNPAKVYQEPNASSHIIYHVEQHQSIVVIGDAPYYFQVKIQNGPEDSVITGYVSKRNIEICEDEVADSLETAELNGP